MGTVERVKSSDGVTTAIYIGDYFEWRGDTATMVKYYYAAGQRIAMRTGSGTGTSGLAWLLSDHLGSTTVTADGATGARVSELRYKAWGSLRYEYGVSTTEFRFNGQRITSSGLLDFKARFFDAKLGCFVQADTIVPLASQGVQAWDRYAGLNNNPVLYVDPSGHR